MKDIKICVFDAYGTLFDFNSAALNYKEEIGEIYNEFSKLWREKQLEYSFLREIMGSYKDFFEVTRDALSYAMETFNIDNKELMRKLMNSYMELDTYEEVKAFLKVLHQRDVKKVILSNGSKKMLKEAIRSSNIEKYIDEYISVEEIEKFKPNEAVYKIITSKYKCLNKEVLFFSSNGWDITGASKYGFNTIWINRFNKVVENLQYKPTIVVNSLEDSLNKFQ